MSLKEKFVKFRGFCQNLENGDVLAEYSGHEIVFRKEKLLSTPLVSYEEAMG